MEISAGVSSAPEPPQRALRRGRCAGDSGGGSEPEWAIDGIGGDGGIHPVDGDQAGPRRTERDARRTQIDAVEDGAARADRQHHLRLHEGGAVIVGLRRFRGEAPVDAPVSQALQVEIRADQGQRRDFESSGQQRPGADIEFEPLDGREVRIRRIGDIADAHPLGHQMRRG